MFELHRSGEVNDARVIEKLDALLATEAAAQAEAPPSPDAPPAWCAHCGEPLRPGQRWCTQCGREATAPVLAPAGARRGSQRWLVAAGIAVFAAAAGAGAAIAAGAIGGDASTATVTATVAAPSATGVVTGGGTATAPAQAATAPAPAPTATAPTATAPAQGTTAPSATTATSASVPVWPRDRVGFTVIALAGDRTTAARRARELAAAGLEAGIVDGAAHQGLADSLWMTWVGRYGTEAEARAAAEKLRADGTSPGYAQEIVPEP